MNLNDVFVRLCYGELKNLALSSGGMIDSSEHPQLVGHINHALTLLHSRFALRRGFFTLRVTPDHTTYVLRPGEAQIISPLSDELIAITEVKNEQGASIPIDMPDAGFHLRRLAHDTLLIEDVPNLETAEDWKVEYVARHPRINLPANLTQAIQLPPMFEEALLMKVAARVYDGMNGEENAAKAARLDKQYAAFCVEAEMSGQTLTSVVAGGRRFGDRGFV